MRLNGLDFHVEVDGDGPPLLLLHGFTGSMRSFDLLRPALVGRSKVISVDLIGHGLSAAPPDPQRYSLEWSTRDLVALLDGLALARVNMLGYSMGGRVALRFAMDAPERVNRLILESASPGIEDEPARSRRIASDAALADRLERIGIAAFVDEWERQPLLALGSHVPPAVIEAQRLERLGHTPTGLANSLRGMGAGQQPPLWSRLPELQANVALIVGERDTRYGQIAERMHALLPRSRLTVIADAGHTAHLDQPSQFAHSVREVLDIKLTQSTIRC